MLSVFKRRKKFSRENLEFQCTLLIKNITINERNKKILISALQQIAELIIWGDQNDDTFFDVIAENKIFDKFTFIIKQQYDNYVTTQVLQTLSIIIENISSTRSLYHLFSNNHINDLIIYNLDFNNTDVLGFYIILLRQISSKFDENVVNFFFNSETNDFPLYVMALKFFKNENHTVRTKVMQIILNIFKVCTKHNELKNFISKHAALSYFYELIIFIKNDCIQLNKAIISTGHKLENKIRSHIDHYYYLEDILSFNLVSLSHILMNQLLSHLILPVFIASLIEDKDETEMKYNDIYHTNRISKHLSLFILTQIYDIFSNKEVKDSIIICLMHRHPPKLMNQIITEPPQYAIDTNIPIHYVLLSHKISEIIEELNTRENTASFHRQFVVENDGIKRAEIKDVQTVDIIDNDSVLLQKRNICRDTILRILKSSVTEDNNEDVIAAMGCLILIMVRSENNSKMALIEFNTDGNDNNEHYPSVIIQCILSILSKYAKLKVFTMRVFIELLIVLVNDSTMYNGLSQLHYNALSMMWKSIQTDLLEYLLNDITAKIHLIDAFEEEWNIIQKQQRIETLIANPNTLLPINTTPYKRSHNRFHALIKNILQFIRIKKEVLETDTTRLIVPFIARKDIKYYNGLKVPLSTVASGCLKCFVLSNNDQERRRVFFSTREPDWLLLFIRVANNTGLCMMHITVAIHSVEAKVDALDQRIIRATVRSSSNDEYKWTITLLFDSAMNDSTKDRNASIALEYITMNRLRVRRRMMQKLEEIIYDEDEKDDDDCSDITYNV